MTAASQVPSGTARERPILFSRPMVRAILAGQKTQTRRVMTHRRGPLAKVGDTLWVRETWCPIPEDLGGAEHDVIYRADMSDDQLREEAQVARIMKSLVATWRPSIHMPRWASRITLDVTGVRREHLQDISEADASAEGVEPLPCVYIGGRCNSNRCPHHNNRRYCTAFAGLWNSINAEREGCSWSENPSVWVIEFRLLEGGHNHG